MVIIGDSTPIFPYILVLIAADDRDGADVLVREAAQVVRKAIAGIFQLPRLGPP